MFLLLLLLLMMVLHKEEKKEQSSGSNSLSTSIIPTAAGEGEGAAASHTQTTDHRNSDASHDQKLRTTKESRQSSIEMGESNGNGNGGEYISVGEVHSPRPRVDNFQKLSLLPLVFIIFYEVSGGPFGVEDSVQAAGPLLALVGFLEIKPIIHLSLVIRFEHKRFKAKFLSARLEE
ncbi:polyamine transporter [Pyrus ussuriensis x Pyrus communis]|uniref:Polyamine transporter n=1 Tax=Pyrus ussuriensis x Pyrus communis TaxID=2448454 RepID=A0A5N5I0V9_9ROSA|nr:polyamine transporter [Pyrus ussuriensis x Pyrus communis]